MSQKPSSTTKPWEHAKAGEGSASDPLAARFVESLSYDRRLYTYDIRGSIAHARMLASVKIITADELAQIERGLNEIEAEITANFDGWPGWKVELEDVHMCIEAALTEKVGDAGRKLHTGRSRNDQVALDLKLWAVDAADKLRAQFDALFRAFVQLAERDGQIVMPSYTHLQRAQPIVVGGEVMAWLAALDRAQRRLTALVTVNRRNPLGSGAIAGSGLPLDRSHTAEALGVGAPTPSSIDGTANRDMAIDFVYALSMVAMTLSRWAEQWIIYASTEFSFIKMDDRYTTGSSMMPQKRNPDMLELIRGRSGNVYGNLTALLTMCKGITIGYNRDLQEDKRHLFAAYDITSDCLEMATRIVATVKFNGEHIKAGIDRGFLDATSLADYLVTKQVPFRTAHRIVGSLVRLCEMRKLPKLGDLSLNDFNAAAHEAGAADCCGQDVYDWLGAEKVVQRYRSYGNAGTVGFREQLQTWRDRLDGRDDDGM